MGSTNPVRNAILNKSPPFGGWIQIGHPVVAEIMSHAGFDWLCIDWEHTDINLTQTTALMRAMDKTSCVPIVRVPQNDTLLIRQVLDAGARGIIVPMINSPQQAKDAVKAAKYYPEGVRGYGFSRANKYGCDFSEHVKTANEDILVIVQIEHVEAVNNIDEILSTEGVDGIFIGPLDLSGSMGIPGELHHSKMIEAMQILLQACKKANISAGMPLATAAAKEVQQALDDGITFLALGIDTSFLNRGSQECVTAARTVASQSKN